MDLKTILALTAISNILIFISLFLFIKLSKEKNKIFDIYTWGKFIQATGWVLLVFRGFVPDIISISLIFIDTVEKSINDGANDDDLPF